MLTRFNNGPWSGASDMMICPMSIRVAILSVIRCPRKIHGMLPPNTKLRKNGQVKRWK
jgi:hypothetical protein